MAKILKKSKLVTQIVYNGHGNPSQPLSKLIEMLERYTLAASRSSLRVPDFYPDKVPAYFKPGMMRFSGAFEEVTYAFCVDTNDPVLIGIIREVLKCP